MGASWVDWDAPYLVGGPYRVLNDVKSTSYGNIIPSHMNLSVEPVVAEI